MLDVYRIAIPIGDPNGIGPEVVCKTLASVTPLQEVVPILIGSKHAIETANGFSGTNLQFSTVRSVLDPVPSGTIPILDDQTLNPVDLTIGRASAAAGHAQVAWVERADSMCREGTAQALLMGPINSEAVELANSWAAIEQLVEPTPNVSYLLVITGPLRVVHLIHHKPVVEVCRLIKKETVLHALEMIEQNFEKWGTPKPRIGVAGWNPHAYGEEEKLEITPAILEGRARGMTVSGPVSPDTIFRHAIEGRYDVVLAMSHDQGHIAIKTWGFKGNFSLTLGPPYISTSVAHGTAYDIAGQGVAAPDNFREAYLATVRLLLGHGVTV